jgi:hypothetical protein
MQRSARVLRSALFSVDSPVNRVTAVVAEGLPQSCVAAVSRLVLVGRGGLRLHEEVFLTGIRVRGQAMAEAKVEQVLDEALDAENLTLAFEKVRTALADLWNTDESRLRTRLLTAMARKAESRQEKVTEALQARRDADIGRAREIFGAFRINLHESRDGLARNCSPTTSKHSAAATCGGWKTGWRAWTRRSGVRPSRSASGTAISSRTCPPRRSCSR